MYLKINTLVMVSVVLILLNIAGSSDIFVTSIIASLCNCGHRVNYVSVLEMS